MAKEQGFDLVEVAPEARPPVCRIMDFGKFLYQQKKKAHDSKKKQKQYQVKEVKFRPNIDEHDYEVKLKRALRFLAEGDKVKATVQFRGREMSQPELGLNLLKRFAETSASSGVPGRHPRKWPETGCTWSSAARTSKKSAPAERAGPPRGERAAGGKR